jgi:serine/threonine protein kinase
VKELRLALEAEAQFLKQAIQARLVDAEKGTAALTVYAQLRKMGAKFTFSEFLVERGLLSAAAAEALTTGQQIRRVSQVGDYVLRGLLGEGQCGSVFRARQVSLNRYVALKILNTRFAADPENVQRFQHEARATARFSHPHIVQGIDSGSDQGLHYFAMELVDGGSARALIDSAPGTMAEDTALEIARQTAEGLTAAHAAGFVHRDVKPDNILLTQEGVAKLADLGISQPVARGGGEVEFWASPPYVAPEVIQGHPADARSDIYSLGATMFEMLAGTPPFPAQAPEEIFRLHLNEAPPDVRAARPDVRYETAALINQMLAKDPVQRTSSAAVVAEAITQILQSQPEAPAAEPAPPKPARPGAQLRGKFVKPQSKTMRAPPRRRRYRPRR